MNYQVRYLEDQAEFDRAMLALQNAPWIGFDTEFVGEKTYVPLLCLLQIVSEQEILLVDVLRIKNLDAFLVLLKQPEILKITHAGDNDYRLLYQLYGVVPVNTFDTQIAAGFVGYNYPAGFARIVERELSVTLAKSHTVADWEARPIDPKALEYAIEDVKYLPALHHRLTGKLKRRHRETWTQEENKKWETESFYVADPYREVLAGDFVYQLDFRDRIFLLRLYAWRREKAAAANVPKDAILQSKHISTVVKSMRHGVQSFRNNRTLPENVWKKHQSDWEKMYKAPATEAERAWLQALPAPAPDDPEKEWTMELLYHFIKKQCLEHEISAALLFPRGDFNKLKTGNDFDESLLQGWRAELLGANLVQWLKKAAEMQVRWEGDACILTMKEA
jgi:ribonuclease D